MYGAYYNHAPNGENEIFIKSSEKIASLSLPGDFFIQPNSSYIKIFPFFTAVWYTYVYREKADD